MNLPDYERVIYKRNPLVEVVCQLRFPTILKIANQDPVELQDNIRDDYPLLEISKEIPFIPEFARMLQPGEVQSFTETVYNFRSEDLKWQVSLNRNFIGFTTKEYKRYEIFKEKFQKIVEIFEGIYKPAFYSRIGLRYQDLIVRSKLNIDNNWVELIPDYIAPEFHSSEIADSVIAFTKAVVIDLNSSKVIFRHGLVEARDTEESIGEPAYLLDADFFIEEKVERGKNVWEILDHYNQSARRLFRWSITEKLHLAMEPVPVDNETTSS